MCTATRGKKKINENFLADKEMKSLLPKSESIEAKDLGWKDNLSEIDKIKIRLYNCTLCD